MSDMTPLFAGGTRRATYAESIASQIDVPDVVVPIDSAPVAFWSGLILIFEERYVFSMMFSATLDRWWKEVVWTFGFSRGSMSTQDWLRQAIQTGRVALPPSGGSRSAFAKPEEPRPQKIPAEIRLSLVELLLDLKPDLGTWLEERVNVLAQRNKVGVRMLDCRFVDSTAEYLHQEVVRPSLLILHDPRWTEVDTLLRKAHDRLLGGDPAGSITASTSAVEAMLKACGAVGATLQPLAKSARAKGLLGPGEEQLITKLEAFRGDADAHRVGTDDDDLARLVLHVCSALALYIEGKGAKQQSA